MNDSNLSDQPMTEIIEKSGLQAQLPLIWFANEDITDSDELYLTKLLEESFEQWVHESESLPLLKGIVTLCGIDGNAIMEAGSGLAGTARPECETDEAAADACRRMERIVSGAYAAVPVCKRSEPQAFAALVVRSVDETQHAADLLEAASLHFRSVFYRRFEQLFVRDLLIQHQRSDREAKLRDILYHITKRLHSQNDAGSVLSTLLMDMESLYPHADIDLYLSQDHVTADERVKPLLIRQSSTDFYAKAFLQGSPVIDNGERECIKLAIPMNGNQAVYGVLGIGMRKDEWDESDLQSFIMLAEAAGSAFETAKLFEQSNLLIGELLVINEIAKRLNQSLRLKEIFNFTMTELLHIFNADYCNLMQLNKETGMFQVMATNLPDIVNESFTAEYGFCGIVCRTKEPLIISDYHSSRIVSSKMMDATGARSLIAAPVMAGADVVGVIMVAHKSPNHFSYSNYKLLSVLSTHIGLALSNASLHAEVRRMVITDNLTGLHVRHYLNEQIQGRMRKDNCGSLIVVDIDNFKKVNDTYGHQTGDSILVSVCDAIRSCIRESDIAARWGGEELAIYLPQIRSDQAYRIAERIRSKVEENTSPSVTVSCGLSEWTCEEEKISVESLFYRADMALYEAKNSGRNRVFIGV